MLNQEQPITRYQVSVLAMAVSSLIACSAPQVSNVPEVPLNTVTLDNTVTIVAGQTVYVPIYSHIDMGAQHQTLKLAATLSIRNTDMVNPIIVSSVTYYDSRGNLIRNYLDQPIELKSLASAQFVVEQDDTIGGSGAAFVVEWVAQQRVTNPVIESVMISTSGNQGISFVSAGRVIKSRINSE